MKCPKCKRELEENTLKCPDCKTRTGMLCPDCGAFNPISAHRCSKCNKVLIKICEKCGAANLPDSVFCRKCKTPFEGAKQETQQAGQNSVNGYPKYFASTNSQQKIKNKLIEAIKDYDIKIITLSGESGIGKNLVIKSVVNELKETNLLWLLGNCTQVSQLSPFGYFQDLFLSFFNINNFCPDTLQLKKNSMHFFKQDFPSLSNEEISDLLNFLYPEEIDKYENIYFNKVKMFSILKKVIETIISKMKIVFIVDGIEFIDGMSFDFLKEILNDKEISSRCKVIVTSKDPKPGLGIFPISDFTADKYLDLAIAPFSDLQAMSFVKQRCGMTFDNKYIDKAIKISKGNPAVLEQAIFLKEDIQRHNLKDFEIISIENILQKRLNILKKYNISAYKILIIMAILGEKCFPAILEGYDNLTEQNIEQAIKDLVNLGYVESVSNLAFEFKSFDIWKNIVQIVKEDSDFEEITNSLYETLSMYKLSSIALLGYILQKLNNNDKAFEVWTLLIKQAAYIGDIGLYIIGQKQALKLIENKTSEFYQHVKKNIYTRVGKLLESIDASSSFDYLQKAIMMLGDNDDAEHIELLGYIASCMMQNGNYCGAIECIDNVLNKIPQGMEFAKILVKSKTILPQLKLGNYGELINSIENDLLPEIENVLGKGKDVPVIKMQDLFNIWVDVYFAFAEALVFQGNSRAFDIIQTIYEILGKNNIDNSELNCKLDLLLAMANTVKGDFAVSNKILGDIIKDYSFSKMPPLLISRWNFTDMLNKLFSQEYDLLNNELFNVTAYANNANDNFTKNILKTILANVLKNNNHIKKALEILEEQVTYFAKEKMAVGVLLSWYLIAEIKLITNGTQFALDIATKALDVAQSPNINNYYFMAIFNKMIGEIYLAKQDFDSAKVYVEKSIFLAKQFDLQYILVKAYLLYAKIYQELALPKTSKRVEYIKQAIKIFQLAKNVYVVKENQVFLKLIKDDLNVLTSFCKLNGIVLKKDGE